MRQYHVPSVSIAFADGGRIAWTHSLGANVDTLFQAASISKVIAATATLRLVDEGTLALDDDVNRYLRTWQVPDNPFTATEKVTLRRILSHTAGVTHHSVESYRDNEPLPTMRQVLEGEPPAKGDPIRVDAVPGSLRRYSGGGITIEQLLLTDVTAQPFASLIERLVLAPIGMHDTSFAQPLPPALQARAASPHDARGERLPNELYVQAAAAGLWTTPSDLLKWAIEIADARDGKSHRVLSHAMAQQMLRVEKAPFGLGPVVQGEGRALHFGHSGWNGGFHSELVYFPALRQGAVVMVNGDGGRPMVREILYAIAAEYGWPDFSPTTIDVITVDDAVLDRVVGTYVIEKPTKVTMSITREGKQLFSSAPILGVRTALYFVSPSEMMTLNGDPFDLVFDDSGRVTALQYGPLRIPRATRTSPQ